MHKIVCTKTRHFLNVPNGSFCKYEITSSTRRSYTTDLRATLDSVAKEYKIQQFDDWYKLTSKDFSRAIGSRFQNEYSSSPSRLLSSIYPEYPWVSWKFNTTSTLQPDIKRPVMFMEWVAKQLSIKEMSDWYNKIIELGGQPILLLNNNSLFQLLTTVYPEYNWLPWKFDNCPREFWSDVKNQRKFMDWAGKELGIKEMSDWYHVTSSDIIKMGGNNLLQVNNHSLFKALCNVYSEYEWLPWKFDKTPNHFWGEKENQRKFMDWAGKELGIKEMSDWYKVTVKSINDLGGRTILVHNSGTLANALATIYPEYKWLPWKFDACPRNFWGDVSNQRKFTEWAGKELKIKEMTDWYNVTSQNFIDLGGAVLLKQYPSLPKLLEAIYPDYEWLPWKFQTVNRTNVNDLNKSM